MKKNYDKEGLSLLLDEVIGDERKYDRVLILKENDFEPSIIAPNEIVTRLSQDKNTLTVYWNDEGVIKDVSRQLNEISPNILKKLSLVSNNKSKNVSLIKDIVSIYGCAQNRMFINTRWENNAALLLDDLLYLSEWTSSQFSFLQCFLNFSSHLNEASRISISRFETKDYTIKYYDDLLKETSKWLKNVKPMPVKSPIFWMELADKNHRPFNDRIKRKIMLAHFGLDYRYDDKNMPRGETYTAVQAAKFISDKLDLNLESHNVIERCIETNLFSAYFNKNLFEFEDEFFSQFPPPSPASLEQIKFSLEHKGLSLYYPSPYEGLIKLKKKPGYGEHESQTLLQIRDGGDIQFKEGLYIQLSFSEYVAGRSFVAFLSGNRVGSSRDKKITISDLLFRKEELESFCEENIKNNAKQLIQVASGSKKTRLDHQHDKTSGLKASESEESASAQVLNREAIKKIFSGGDKKLNDSKWKKLFEGEKENELNLARAKNQGNRAFYDQNALCRWLIARGYFSHKELHKILGIPENNPKTFGWGKIQ